jgi:hypothetical protein
MSLERSPIVYVEWIDSSRSDGWADRKEIGVLAHGKDELLCWSVGLLIEESDDRIVISTSENPAHDAISPLAIPRCAITRIKKRTVASVFGPARKEAK